MPRLGRSAALRASALAIVLIGTTSAQAAVWQWGCVGRAGGKLIAFNREKMLLSATAKGLGELEAVVQTGRFQTGDGAEVYLPEQDNNGLEPRMSFKHESDDKRRVVLTETRSRKTSASSKLVAGCRDETVERTSKTFRVELPGEAPLTATFTCMDYQLSTRGGRTCR